MSLPRFFAKNSLMSYVYLIPYSTREEVVVIVLDIETPRLEKFFLEILANVETPTKRTIMPKVKAAPVKAVFKSADDELAYHLEKAEDHLIKAVMLFIHDKKPERNADYFKRLERAQEIVTGLFREELVRMRGTKRPR